MDDRAANADGLMYPFLLIEFKGDGSGSTNASLYVATNQYLRGSASCNLLTERFRQNLKRICPLLIQG